MINKNFSKDSFSNQNEVRWCPGCGDYAILSALQKTLANIGESPEKHVFVSGIGCSGRLPYYMNAFGFHTIHGRATAVASGLKLTRPDMTVWIITGDGDGLSIGAGHLIHLLRRNINVNILLLNNQVYGLTKGQFSPTSVIGQITKTSPGGVNQNPMNPLMLALGSGAKFIARSIDKDPIHMSQIFEAAYRFQGCAFVEIYQDCHVFNSGAFDAFSTKTQRQSEVLYLEDQKPMLYGSALQQGGLVIDQNGVHKVTPLEQVMLHDQNDFLKAVQLANLHYPEYPVPVGVLYESKAPIYAFTNQGMVDTNALKELYRKGATWSR